MYMTLGYNDHVMLSVAYNYRQHKWCVRIF